MTMWIRNFCKTAFNANPNAIVLYFLYQSSVVTVAFCSMKLWLSTKTNVLHQIIHFFLILLKCMCFIYRHNYMVHSFIIHRFFQCIFANFCYQFQPFFVHMHRYFPWGFLKVFLKQFSQYFFIGFFTGVFIGNFIKLWS